jgi:hypothetical protein
MDVDGIFLWYLSKINHSLESITFRLWLIPEMAMAAMAAMALRNGDQPSCGSNSDKLQNIMVC